jgi:hypothetical protein
MKRRGTPEADLQRAVVSALRVALPKGAIAHHCVNEVTEPGPRCEFSGGCSPLSWVRGH